MKWTKNMRQKKYEEKNFFNFIFLIRKIIKIDSTIRNILHKIFTIKESIKKTIYSYLWYTMIKYFFLLNIKNDINKDMYLEF